VLCAADTSTFIAFFNAERGTDVEKLDAALAARQLLVPPLVIAELLSDPKLSELNREVFSALPMLQLTKGFWIRVGLSRAELLRRKLKARLADALIAQACIDNRVPLIARDRDFRHFAQYCGLELL